MLTLSSELLDVLSDVAIETGIQNYDDLPTKYKQRIAEAYVLDEVHDVADAIINENGLYPSIAQVVSPNAREADALALADIIKQITLVNCEEMVADEYELIAETIQRERQGVS